jgi:predicted RNA-binding protein
MHLRRCGPGGPASINKKPDSVDVLEPNADAENSWRLVDLFGDQKTIRCRIKRMNLVDHRIVFEASAIEGMRRPDPNTFC